MSRHLKKLMSVVLIMSMVLSSTMPALAEGNIMNESNIQSVEETEVVESETELVESEVIVAEFETTEEVAESYHEENVEAEDDSSADDLVDENNSLNEVDEEKNLNELLKTDDEKATSDDSNIEEADENTENVTDNVDDSEKAADNNNANDSKIENEVNDEVDSKVEADKKVETQNKVVDDNESTTDSNAVEENNVNNKENDDDKNNIADDAAETNTATDSNINDDINDIYNTDLTVDKIDLVATISSINDDIVIVATTSESDIEIATISDVEISIATKSDTVEIFGEVATESNLTATTSEVTVYKNGYLPEGFEVPMPEKPLFDDNLFGTTPIPTSYDSRTVMNPANNSMSIVPTIRNQVGGTCWAYASTALVEIAMRKKGLVDNEEDANLSELALAYFAYNLKNVTRSTSANKDTPGVEGNDYTEIQSPAGTCDFLSSGGNVGGAGNMLSAYMGAVAENVDSSLAESYATTAQSSGINGRYAFNNNSIEVSDVIYLNKNDRDAVKQAIREYGAVAISFYGDGSGFNATSFDYVHNGEHYQFPNGDSGEGQARSANHAIVIVGWDDTIPASYFRNTSTSHPGQATSNGGWLCRNSWGDYSYANGGYFWMSYEEPSINTNMYAIDVIEKDTYKYNYHYDTTNVQSATGFGDTYDMAFANIFKVNSNADEKLDAVQVGLWSANMTFDLRIYTKATAMTNPSDGTLQLTMTDLNKREPGIYTIPLTNSVALTKGTYYSIILVAKSADGGTFFIMTDKQSQSANYDDSGNIYYVNYRNEAALGQSMNAIYNGGNFYQWGDLNTNDAGNSTLQTIDGVVCGQNYRIRGLTNPAVAPAPAPAEGHYLFAPGWLDGSLAGINNSQVTKITFLKYNNSVPTGTGVTEWDLPATSHGLKGYTKGTEVYIYAPADVPIKFAQDSSYLFSGDITTDDHSNSLLPTITGTFNSLTSIVGLEKVDTSDVTNMQGMFYCAPTLTSLNLSNFNTSKVTDMSLMFAESLSGVTNLDLSSFTTTNVSNFSKMFFDAGVKNINVSSFNTSAATDMSFMFCDFTGRASGTLETIDLSHFNTASVTNMAHMISAPNVSTINVSSFNTANVTNFEGLFWGMEKLTTINVSNFDTSAATNMKYMFWGCKGLTTLSLTNFNTSSVTTIENMFEECNHLTTLDLSTFNTSNVTEMKEMFKNCSALVTIYAGNSFTAHGTTTDMFLGCSSILGGGVVDYDPTIVDGTYARIATATIPGYFTKSGAVSYKIKYNIGTAEATTPSDTIKVSGSNATLPTPTVSNNGWIFDGWFKEVGLAHPYDGTTDLSSLEDDAVTVFARWKVKITYNANGHGTAPTADTVIQNKTVTLKSMTNVTGWTFDTNNSWYGEAGCNNFVGKAGTTYTATAPKTLFAKWKENEYTITLNDNGGTYRTGYDKPIKRNYTESKALPTSTDITNVGYTFDGWYGNAECTGTKYTSIPANTASNKTYWLKWIPITYKIKYNIGTAEATTPSNATKTYDNTLTLSNPTNIKPGWTFDGWYKEASLTNPYTGSADLSNTKDDIVEIFAKWKVTITYNSNGHGTAPASKTVVQGSSLTLGSMTNVTGYTFDTVNSWYKEAGCTNFVGRAGASYTANKPITLFAKWNPIRYNIKYNIGTAAATTPSDLEKVYNANATLAVPTVSDQGWIFDGWYKEATYQNKYEGKTDLSTTAGANVTVFAKWKVRVTYNANGHGVAPGAVTVDQNSNVNLPTLADVAGWKFDTVNSWYKEAGCQNFVGKAGATYKTSAPITLFANWIELFNVTFDLTSYITTLPSIAQWEVSATPINPLVVENNKKATRPPMNPTAENSEFLGWFTTSDCTTEFNFDNAITSHTVIYAKWRQATTVKFSFETERGIAPTIQHVVEDTKVAKPLDILVDGYTFKYWYENDVNTPFDFDTIIPSTSDRERTLTALWEANVYNIKYNVGTAEAEAPEDVKKTYDANTMLSTPSDIGDGWIFTGWYKDSEYSDIYDGRYDLATASNAEVTIFAKWLVRITYNANGHGTTDEPFYIDQGTEVKLPALANVEGWTFDLTNSWYKESSCTNLVGKAGETYKVEAPVELFAKWNEVKKEEPENNNNNNNNNSGNNRGYTGGSSGSSTGGGIRTNNLPGQNPAGVSAMQTREQALASGNIKQQAFNSAGATIRSIVRNTESWSFDAATNKWKLSGMDASGISTNVSNTFCQINKMVEINDNGIMKQVEVQDTYYFDEKGEMVTGLMQSADNQWYFFEDAKGENEGKLIIGWKQIGTAWYYFNPNGTMMTNGTTPDGYAIGANGQYVDNSAALLSNTNNNNNVNATVTTNVINSFNTSAVNNNSIVENAQTANNVGGATVNQNGTFSIYDALTNTIRSIFMP